LIENGSKWSKKQKRRREEGKNWPLEENTKEDKSIRKMDRGKIDKWKKLTTDALEHLAGKKEEQASEALETRVKWT
jgi:hypothetical protein